MQRRGKTFIVSGPSGVGKSTVLKALFDQRTDLYFSISATTRDPRPGEVDGVHYHFIPAEEFHRMVEEDEFLEYAEYVGNFYGTPKKYVDRAMDDGRDVILDIEIQGANQICTKRPETVRIFIAPPSWVELERRLTARGTDSQEVIQSRLLRAKVELQTASSYDYLVINDTVEQAVAEMKDAIYKTYYKKKGQAVVDMNYASIDHGINELHQVEIPERWLDARLHAQGIGQHGEVFYAACDKADGFFACRVR